MGKRKRNSLSRKTGTRHYRPVCWISSEGHTERDYFDMNVFRNLGVSIRFPRDVHPQRVHPAAVLKRLQKSMRDNPLRKSDEAWVVVDVDDWSKEDFDDLLKWSRSDPRHHVAISNPKFELFLVMHFGKGNGCTTPARVDDALGRCMPGYDKRLSRDRFGVSEVAQAIENARAKRLGCDSAIPDPGMTDVYKLADSLLER